MSKIFKQKDFIKIIFIIIDWIERFFRVYCFSCVRLVTAP